MYEIFEMVVPIEMKETILNELLSTTCRIVDGASRDAKRYTHCTSSLTRRVLAVASPSDEEEIREVLAVARKHKISVHPISRGRNWGYGSATPTSNDSIVIDLSGMDRIITVEGALAYCVIEPGVSQHQLSSFLKQQHPDLILDVTGASRDASIVGVVLERGISVGNSADRFHSLGGLRVILADGTTADTGMGRFSGCCSEGAHRYGIGPYIDGLFTQSNFGIVSRAVIYLDRKPDFASAIAVKVSSHEGISKLIDSVRELFQKDLIKGNVKISNDVKAGISIPRFLDMYRVMPESEPVPDKLKKCIQKFDLAPWSAVVVHSGVKDKVKNDSRLCRKALARCGWAISLSLRQLSLLTRLKRPLKWLGLGNLSLQLDLLKQLVTLSCGEPSELGMQGVYFARSAECTSAPTFDLINDDIGLYWYAPVLPLKGDAILKYLQFAQALVESFGFPFPVTLNVIDGRSAIVIINISYDRRSVSESEKAEACYDALVHQSIRGGYLPYRLGQIHAEALNTSSCFDSMVSLLKRALDPLEIISPGKYGIRGIVDHADAN